MKNGDDGKKKNELTKTDSLQKKIDSLIAIQKNQSELLKNEMEEYQPTPSTIIEEEDCMGVNCNVRDLAVKVKNRHRNWDIQYTDSKNDGKYLMQVMEFEGGFANPKSVNRFNIAVTADCDCNVKAINKMNIVYVK